MSEREQVQQIIEAMPEYKISGLLVFLRAFGEDVPNAETVEAMREIDSGGGTLYTGSTADIFAALEKEVTDDA